LLKNDPKLQMEENRVVNYTYQQIAKNKTLWNYIS